MYYASAIESKFNAQKSIMAMLQHSERLSSEWQGNGHEPGWTFRDEITNWQDLVRTLPLIESLWWSPKLAANLLEVSKTFPSDTKIIPEGFPILGNKVAAWCFFDSPPWSEFEADKTEPQPIIAICWQWGINPLKAVLPGLRCQSYTSRGNFIWPVTWAAMEFGETLDQWKKERADKLESWMTDDSERLLRFILTAGAWLQQKLLVVSDEQLNRTDRKRLARTCNLKESQVKVIYLRRREKTNSNESSEHGQAWSRMA